MSFVIGEMCIAGWICLFHRPNLGVEGLYWWRSSRTQQTLLGYMTQEFVLNPGHKTSYFCMLMRRQEAPLSTRPVTIYGRFGLGPSVGVESYSCYYYYEVDNNRIPFAVYWRVFCIFNEHCGWIRSLHWDFCQGRICTWEYLVFSLSSRTQVILRWARCWNKGRTVRGWLLRMRLTSSLRKEVNKNGVWEQRLSRFSTTVYLSLVTCGCFC